MTPKQYREFYIGCTKLYGVIDSDDAFTILKKYYQGADKKHFLKDLSSRVDKFTRQYAIWKTGKRNLYLIVEEMLSDEDLDAIIPLQSDKEFYVPETYQKFLSHSSLGYWEQYNHRDIKELTKLLNKYNPDIAKQCIYIMFFDINSLSYYEKNDPLTMIIKRFIAWGYDFDFEDTRKALSLVQNIYNNTRIWVNRGYTPKELVEKRGPIDINKLQFTLGPNVKESLLNGEIDINEYIKGVLESDIPPLAKQSLLKELTAIKKEIEESKA